MIKLENISFDHCLKCTVCTIYCPIARATPVFPGPKQMGPDTERLRIKNPELLDETLKYCSNCKRCEIACPSDVKIADIIQLAKWKYDRHRFRPRDFLLSRTDLLGWAATTVPTVVNRLTRNPLAKKWLESVLKVPANRVFPRYQRGTFAHWFNKHAPSQSHFPEQVVFYRGCYVNYNDHDLGRAVIQVLNALNIGVVITKERCCGVPLMANGYLAQALNNARFNIKSLSGRIRNHITKIISVSSTCTLALTHEYRNVLGLDNSVLMGRVEYLSRFLNRIFELRPMLNMKPVILTAAYHAPCHLERRGGSIDTIELLRRVPGLNLKLLHSQCCGLAGTYGFKSEFHSISQEVGGDVFRRLAVIKPDVVVTDCETCKWQIEMNTPFPVVHPVTILAQALSAVAGREPSPPMAKR